MAASAPPRRVLVAWSDDWADTARTLRWSLAHVVRPSDRVSLLHVRCTEGLLPTALPVVEVSMPLPTLLSAWHSGDLGPASKAVAYALQTLQSAAAEVDATELRTTLSRSDALIAFLRHTASSSKPPAFLVMGSHGARNVGGATWKVSHTSLDVAAQLTVCPLYLARPRDAATLDVASEPESVPSAPASRSIVIALDGAAPGSSLLTRWFISNALRPSDHVTVLHREVGAAQEAVDAELARCCDMLRSASCAGARFASFKPSTNLQTLLGGASTFRLPAHLVDLSESGLDATQGPPDLMVLGSRGEAAMSLKRLVLGSTADYVLKMAACSVLLVPPLHLTVPGAIP